MFKKLLKRAVIILISILISANLYSQAWCPAGATWYYNGNALGFNGYHKLTYVNDTTINSISCKKIIDHLHGYSSTTIDVDIDTFYCYEQNGVVYMYNNKYGKNQFDTLYDINANIGDTWQMPRADTACDSINVTVLNTGNRIINGNSLKQLSVGYPPYGGGTFTDTIVEGLGYIKTFFYFPMVCQYIDERMFNGLRCYSDSIFGEYSTGIQSACDDYYTNIVPLDGDKDIQIYPTVTNNYVNVEMGLLKDLRGSFMLFDMAGRNVLTEKVDNNKRVNMFDTSLINSGIYFYKINADNKYFKTGKLIIVK